VSADELRASINRAAGMPPSGESTSAALRRVTAERDQANELTDKIAVELRGVTRERDALARRCAVRFEETQALKAELESARAELALVRRQRDTLRADLDRARNRAEAAERALTYRGEKSMPEDEASTFYEPGATYTSRKFPQYGWRFRCDAITTHPDDGERVALGWRYYQDEWQPYAYGELDWSEDEAIVPIRREVRNA
jgi:hypothetical protein